MPVGRVEYTYMYPLSFRKFLVANNEKGLVNNINSYDFSHPFSKAIH